jgi:hypothetical protein
LELRCRSLPVAVVAHGVAAGVVTLTLLRADALPFDALINGTGAGLDADAGRPEGLAWTMLACIVALAVSLLSNSHRSASSPHPGPHLLLAATATTTVAATPRHAKGLTVVNRQLDEHAFARHLAFHQVTRQVAVAIHRELRRQHDKELLRLLQGRLASQFVYDFLSCMAGHHLDGASMLGGALPHRSEYAAGGQFYWSGLYIAVIRDARIPPFKPGSIRGICVFHDAYLSSYPGPNAFFHSVDPRLTKFRVDGSPQWAGPAAAAAAVAAAAAAAAAAELPQMGISKNRNSRLALALPTTPQRKDTKRRRRSRTPRRAGKIADDVCAHADEYERTRLSGDLRDEFYDQPGILDAAAAHASGTGSKSWCDVPVLAGPGVGRLLLAHCMQLRCGHRMASEGVRAKKWRKRLSSEIPLNFMVSVAGGVTNTRMLSLLDSFGFTRLYMTHPKTGEAWKDEAGAELYVVTRKGPLREFVARAQKVRTRGTVP